MNSAFGDIPRARYKATRGMCHCALATRVGFEVGRQERSSIQCEAAMAATPYDTITEDLKSGVWNRDLYQIPFLESLCKRIGEEQGSVPWKAVDVGCGTGHHTIGLLKAGASSVLAFDISKNMIEEAKIEVGKFLDSNDQIRGEVDFPVASATNWSSIPEVQEGEFSLAICVFVFTTLLSKDEVKQALAEIFKMLRPGGKLLIYEEHVIHCMECADETLHPQLYASITPKEDGSRYNYFKDEGTPQEVVVKVNSGRSIKFIDRLYTLSSWVSFIREAGFQITQLHEPYLDPKILPADAADYMKFSAGKPMGMCWECTKPLSQ